MKVMKKSSRVLLVYFCLSVSEVLHKLRTILEGDSDSAAVSSPKVNVSGSVAPLTLISPLSKSDFSLKVHSFSKRNSVIMFELRSFSGPESPSACAIHEVDDSPTGGSSSAVAIPEVEDSATGGSSSAVAAQSKSVFFCNFPLVNSVQPIFA